MTYLKASGFLLIFFKGFSFHQEESNIIIFDRILPVHFYSVNIKTRSNYARRISSANNKYLLGASEDRMGADSQS